MFKFIEILRNPISGDSLDHMPIAILMKTKRRISYNGEIHNPTEEFLFNLIVDRVTNLVNNNFPQDTTNDDMVLTCDTVCSGLTFATPKFNKKLNDFITENKLAGYNYDSSLSHFPQYGSEALYDSLAVCTSVLAFVSTDSIANVADIICNKMKSSTHAFDKLNTLVNKYNYLIPAVEHISVDATLDVEGVSITPEMVDGYLAAVKPAFSNETDCAKLREYIIKKFREAANGCASSVDYDRPSISISMPDEWLKDYHTTEKPIEERRERSKEIIAEIKSKVIEHNAHEWFPYNQAITYNGHGDCIPLSPYDPLRRFK